MNALNLSKFNTLPSLCMLLPLLDQICIVIIHTAIASLQSTDKHFLSQNSDLYTIYGQFSYTKFLTTRCIHLHNPGLKDPSSGNKF